MEKIIKFRLAGTSDKAGKIDGINEDNFWMDADLSDSNDENALFTTDKEVVLSSLGALMLVADGMGGTNAGEEASKIAVETAEEFFAPGVVTVDHAATHKCRCAYMEQIIIESNRRILSDQKSNPEHSGMGSTMIMAWLCNGELSVSWIGDSRAYLWRRRTGMIHQVSKDHSYVQSLVDSGKITMEQAFTHPQGNIILKSLGDPDKAAEPESTKLPETVEQGDIILLCSDGISGVLYDRYATDTDGYKISEYNLEDTISENQHSMSSLLSTLFHYAQQSHWYDNCTALLCQITETGDDGDLSSTLDDNNNKITYDTITNIKIRRSTIKNVAMFLIIGLLIGIAIWWFYKPQSPITEPIADTTTTVSIDTTREEIPDETNTSLIDTTANTQIDSVRQDIAQTTKNIGKQETKKNEYKQQLLDKINHHPYLALLEKEIKEEKCEWTNTLYEKYLTKIKEELPKADFLKNLDIKIKQEQNSVQQQHYEKIKDSVQVMTTSEFKQNEQSLNNIMSLTPDN